MTFAKWRPCHGPISDKRPVQTQVMLHQTNRTLRLIALTIGRMPPLPPILLLPGIVTLAFWISLTLQTGVISQSNAVMAFCAGFATQTIVRFYRSNRFGLGWGPTFALLAVIAAPLVALTVLDNMLWCQRWITATLLLNAAIFLPDLWASDQRIGQKRWQHHAYDGMRRTLSGGLLLLIISIATLNEAAIQAISNSEWLVLWAIFPALFHYAWLLILDVILLSRKASPHI